MSFSFEGKIVLVTGGASGIGKIMVRKSLEKGAQAVVIWDFNATGMDAVRSEFQQLGKQIVAVQVDLASATEIQTAASQTLKLVPHIDVLINNAGIVVGKQFVDHSFEDIELTMKINATALMHTTRFFAWND
jgi:all-trans-retinol dehydrogenase (NAD+)